MRGSYLARLSFQVASKVPYATAVKRLGVEFVRAVWPLIRDAPQDDFAFCHRHGAKCRATKLDPDDVSVLDGHVAGMTCVDWSGLGNQLGWLGTSTLPFLVWLADQLRQKLSFIIGECVMNFDDAVLGELIWPMYSLQTFTVTPEQFGCPCTRMRKYMVLLRDSVLAWNPALPDPVATFSNLFNRNVPMPGEVFWNAPPAYVDAYHKAWAKSKHMPEVQGNGMPWPSKLLMTEKTRQRVREWEQ